MPTTSEAKQKKELVWEIPEEQIDGLRLERPDSTVELKKTGPSAWRLVRPEAYPADTATVDDVASQIAKLHRSGGGSAEARPEDYGLPPEKPTAAAGRAAGARARRHARDDHVEGSRRFRPAALSYDRVRSRDPRHRRNGRAGRRKLGGDLRPVIGGRRRPQEGR